MNQTHIHLLITHLPVFGGFLGLIVLIFGFISESDSTKKAAFLVFIIAAIGACIAYITGEAAEESVEHLQGVIHDMIEEHELAAKFALTTNIIVGVASIASLWVSYKKLSFAGLLSKIVLVIALFSFTTSARTAFLGGKIRHSEIHGNTNNQGGETESDDDENDD